MVVPSPRSLLCFVVLAAIFLHGALARSLARSEDSDSSSSSSKKRQHYRTSYHFQPARHFMNVQADVDSTFEVSRLDDAEDLDPNWNDRQILCNEKGASVQGRLGPFGLYIMASRLEEYTGVFFRVFKRRDKGKGVVVLLCEDHDKRSFGEFLDVAPTGNGKKLSLSLRCLIDHSIMEAFVGGGKVSITSRVYPTKAISRDAHFFVFNKGAMGGRLKNLRA